MPSRPTGPATTFPQAHAHKPILSCDRGPYEWYVSQYEFGWWKRTFDYHPDEPLPPAGWAIERVLPSFISAHPHLPKVSFASS